MRPGAFVAPLSLALMSASPAPQREIPSGLGSEALVIPAGSPVRFARYGERYEGHFRGRFVLTGTFFYGCEIECNPPLQKDQLFVAVIPDRAIEATLPHWKIRNGHMRIFLNGGERLAHQIVTKREEAALLAGKIDDVRRHVSIVVDDFRAGIDCDGAVYSARFIAVAKPVEVARAKLDDSYGCG